MTTMSGLVTSYKCIVIVYPATSTIISEPLCHHHKNLKQSGWGWEGLVDKHQEQSLDPQNLHKLPIGTACLNPSTGEEERRDFWGKLLTEVSKSPG